MDDAISFDAMRAEIDRKQADLEAAERRLESVTTTVRSPDGLAEVTVSATGTVTSIRLAPETFRRSTPQYLGTAITEAAQQATRQVKQSTQAAVAPIAAVGQGLAEAVDEPRAPHAHASSDQPVGTGIEVTSTDRSARVGVDALGVVAVIHIAPDVYRGGNTTRLAAAITEAAERAARQMYETRMSSVESAIGLTDLPDMETFFPTPVTSEPASPVATPGPPAYIPPTAPVAPSITQWNPISGRPGEKIVGPSDWDDDMGDYGGGRQSWLR